jgi:carbon monoxide dehydrogenase subunit G
MKMSGEEIIAAPRQVVWDALNDPEVLKQCITGCEEIKKKSDTEMEAKVTAKVGPVKASFVGAMKLSKLNPPRSYVISGEGKGGMAGFAKGGATVQLSDTADGQTKLSYDVDAQVGGKLAQIGSRLIDSTAKKMAADFFKKFNKVVSDRAQAAGTEEKSKPAAKKSAAKKSCSQEVCGQEVRKEGGEQDRSRRERCETRSEESGREVCHQGKCCRWCGQEGCKEGGKQDNQDRSSRKLYGQGLSQVRQDDDQVSGQVSKESHQICHQVCIQSSQQGHEEGIRQGSKRSNSAVSTVEGAAAEARQASVQTAATASNAVETAAASASAGADKVANTMPPQAKSMSTMWMLVMAAAAIGLLLIWASGKG